MAQARTRIVVALLVPLVAATSLPLLHCGRGGAPGDDAATQATVGSVGALGVDAPIGETTGESGERPLDAELRDAADAPDEADTIEANLPLLAATAQIVWVYAEPRPGATKLGYLRAGAVVARDDKPSSEEGCKAGWYGVRPRGFVCAGDHATVDMDDPTVVALRQVPRANRSAPLPYAYGVARNQLAPFYARIPTHEESLKLEEGLDDHLARVRRQLASIADGGVEDGGPEYDAGVGLQGPPAFLRDKHVVPNVSGLIASPRALHAGRPRTKEGFAIVASFWSGPGGTDPTGAPDDRRFDLTAEYLLLPHDRLRPVRPSTFHGIAFAEGEGLPVAFTRPRHHISKVKLEGGATEGPLPPRTALPLTGQTRRFSGADYYETKDGWWVKGEDVIRVDAPKSLPAFAKKGEKWIDVSIAHQSLVAFEGDKAVYATLVSTGRDGLGDPESTKATIRGVYRIGTKHVSVTMDSDEVGEEFSLRDVPYVQYFETGYAIHGAYWHDGFGEPRSHGCINLAELDAQFLFGWTGPEVPEAWHAAMARPLATGTPIWIHV
ncbi:MAG: hypothetical protein NVSMB47_04030 [Polyangiales bacterium]